jgi:hypothetical protein
VTRLKTPMLLMAGAFLLWCLTVTLQSMAGSGPDRSPAIQGPLALLVLGGPLLSYLLRARRERLRWPLLAAQLGCYVLYETGISIDTDIRVDVLLIYPAILLNAWILLRTPRPPGDPAVRLTAAVRLAGILGLLVALTGLAGSGFLLGSPAMIEELTWAATADSGSAQIFPTPEARQEALDRLRVPPWFRPYCLGVGAAGLAAACVFLWGAWRLLRSAPRGPALFMLGAVLYMLVAACIAAAGLVSQAPMIRENLVPAVCLLVLTGILLVVVRRSAEPTSNRQFRR